MASLVSRSAQSRWSGADLMSPVRGRKRGFTPSGSGQSVCVVMRSTGHSRMRFLLFVERGTSTMSRISHSRIPCLHNVRSPPSISPLRSSTPGNTSVSDSYSGVSSALECIWAGDDTGGMSTGGDGHAPGEVCRCGDDSSGAACAETADRLRWCGELRTESEWLAVLGGVAGCVACMNSAHGCAFGVYSNDCAISISW